MFLNSNDNLEDDDHRPERSRKTFRRLLPYLLPHWRTFLLGACAMLVAKACELAGPRILGWVVDHGYKAGSADAIRTGTAAFLAAFLLGAGVQYVQVLLLSRMGLRIITRLKERTFGHLLSLSTRFHDKNPVGKLIARTESDAEAVKEAFSRNGVQILGAGVQFLGALGVMLALDAKLALVFVALLPVLGGAVWMFLRLIRRIYRRCRRRYADECAMVTEYVQGVPVVQQFDQKARASRILDERNLAKYRADMRAWVLDYSFWGVFLYVEVLATAGVLWWGFDHILAKTMSFGDLISFLTYGMMIFWPLLHLGENLNQVQKALAAADRVFDLLDTPVEVEDAPGARDDLEFARELRFEGVSFSYTGTEMVLQDVSFGLRKGEKIALVGPSGGGKTTLVSLLLRFVDPTRGRILVDGVDVRDFTLSAWRGKLGLVLQEIYLFPGTVLDNLRVLDDSVPGEAVEQAAETVRADRFIRALPEGYASDLAERGANLSLGERQLLSFARALAIDPEILILDEATSSVDAETEARIQESLDRLLRGRTAVIVAHRLSTVRKVDRILVIESGRIVEEGDHETLLARGGLYRELHDLQMRGNSAGRRGRP